MLFTRISLSILPLLTTFVVATSPQQPLATADILCWPVASPQPSLLARVSYNSTKSDILSYSPPPAPSHGQSQSDDLVRVGLYTSTLVDPKHWIGTLTSLDSLTATGDDKPGIQLHLGPSNEVYHVSVGRSTFAKDPTTETTPDIELVLPETGPRPHLNRPVAVSPDGQAPQEVVEKTFFQK